MYFGEDSRDETSEQWTTDVGTNINRAGLGCIREQCGVSNLLEPGLEESDDWVDASTRDSTRHLQSHVECKCNRDRIDWQVGGTVVLFDHVDEAAEHESADGLSDEYLDDECSLIVASSAWAELQEVVSVLGD